MIKMQQHGLHSSAKEELALVGPFYYHGYWVARQVERAQRGALERMVDCHL